MVPLRRQQPVVAFANALSLTLVLCGFIAGLVAMYDQFRFHRKWRQETLAKAPDADENSIAFAWFYAPFLDNVSAECNALRRRSNRSLIVFLAMLGVGFIFMSSMHSVGVYPAGPVN